MVAGELSKEISVLRWHNLGGVRLLVSFSWALNGLISARAPSLRPQGYTKSKSMSNALKPLEQIQLITLGY